MLTLITTKGVYKQQFQYFQYFQYFRKVSGKFPGKFPTFEISGSFATLPTVKDTTSQDKQLCYYTMLERVRGNYRKQLTVIDISKSGEP